MNIPSLKAGTVIIGIVMFLVSCGDVTPSSSTDNTQNPKDSTQNPTDSTKNPKDSLNLLTNSSFEDTNNQPDFRGWKSNQYFTDSLGKKYAPLFQDAPSDGGIWCIELKPDWNMGIAMSDITGQTGTNIYKISAWLKTNGWHGDIYLHQIRNSVIIDNKMIRDTTTSWKHISFNDTLTVLPMDTLRLYLSAGYTQHSNNKRSWFDNVKVEKVN